MARHKQYDARPAPEDILAEEMDIMVRAGRLSKSLRLRSTRDLAPDSSPNSLDVIRRCFDKGWLDGTVSASLKYRRVYVTLKGWEEALNEKPPLWSDDGPRRKFTDYDTTIR
jgi:hypothetical protein